MSQNEAESLQPTWRLWGEEREEDAIYTVYLKKVRYHRPTPNQNGKESDGEDDISHLEWETVRVRFVKAAKLFKLVEALATDDGELESTFINVFLATYRTFTQPEIVLDLLLQRYERLSLEKIHSESVSDQHKKTLVAALHVWLDNHPEDWSPENLQKLLTFTSKKLPNTELHMKVLNKYSDRFDKHTIKAPVPLPWSQDFYEYQEIPDQFNGLCLSPAFRGPPSHLLHSYRFPNIPVKHFAEQLTRMDMELFKRLIPHQCLGSTWSKRDKIECSSVLATVNQFNAVSFRVISSVLIEPRLKPSERALLISTWIDIAQELRMLKNFSSLKAIISGLQSNPVYRLSKTWASLGREKLELFTELARIFSEENNAWTQREVLMREGTAKFADVVGENDKQLQKVFQKQNTLISHGTIPYLGTFLTDLTFIHAAIPDMLGAGLINFDKKRKEFEVLAQIKLLQSATKSYNLHEDLLFDRWFASLLILDEREAHALSCQLEPTADVRKPSQGHRKTDSIASNSSSGAGSHFYCDINNSNQNSRNNSLDRDVTPPNASIMSTTSSVSSFSIESSASSEKQLVNGKISSKQNGNQMNTSQNSAQNKPGILNNSQYPVINAQLVQNSPLKNGTPDFYIIKVTYEVDHTEIDGVVLYKSIMLGNNERTPQVIRNAMIKLGLDGDPDNYTLSQVLPDKELLMPYNANVYYAKESDGEDDISHLEWETVRVRFVKAAKLFKLVEALATDDGELESTFINVFLATYRTFTQPEIVLDLLLQRYERLSLEKIHSESVSDQHKKTLVAALHVWLDNHPEDWSPENLQKLLTFTSKKLPNTELHMKVLNKYSDRFDKHTIKAPVPLPWSQDFYEYQEIPDQFNGLCLSPAFRGPPSHLLHSYRFPNIPVKHFAEQLTRMDMELFKRLIPHQCLGSTWSKRDKIECSSVLATVNQFNAVSFRVISSVLIEPRLKPSERALLISTWIDIAQELRMLKNFSSLKAIISGLQSNPVYRLSKTWASLGREKLELFTELARIFSEENNAWTQREVLMREGTAKFADVVGENDKQLQKVFQKQNTLISHGTIPYLGTFLTDLTFIHAAIPDMLGAGLINFDKKRKEFEVLAQIKLLQSATKSYNLHEDLLFDRWFASLLILDEREAHALSCQLEPTADVRKPSQGHRKTDSIASNSSSGAGSHFYCDINNSNQNSRNNSLDRDVTPPNASIMSTTSSVSSFSIESSASSEKQLVNGKISSKQNGNQMNTSQNSAQNKPGILNNSQYPVINAQLVQNSPLKNGTPDFYIIKVTYEVDHTEIDGVVLYKSIMLGNNERTPQVIRNAMIKLGLDGDPDNYTLSQVLPDKELLMPYNANVYYAVNTAFNLNFILRRKQSEK